MATRASRPLPRSARPGAAPRKQTDALRWRILAIAGLASILISGAIALGLTLPRPQGAAPAGREYVIFAEFGLTADTVFETLADRPQERKKLFDIPHAAEFGIVPALAPDGRSFAYTVLPPGAIPTPDTPAELWVASLGGKPRPRRLGQDFDVRVAPVWSPDGSTVVVRRSGVDGPYEIVAVAVADGGAITLARSAAPAFPIAFAADGGVLFYAGLSEGGSDLFRYDLAHKSSDPVAHLSDDLTRDWRLSPDGGRLAFLALSGGPGAAYSSHLHVLDLTTREIAASASMAQEFGPGWSPAGELTYASLGDKGFAQIHVGATTMRRPPAVRLDVPLAWSNSSSAVAVRSFEATSPSALGRATLALLRNDGTRTTIASGEVTFVGWTYR